MATRRIGFFSISLAHAAKIELEFKGQKQIIEFDPKNKSDFARAENLWRKADSRTFYVYFETGVFRVYDEPSEQSKFKEIGSWYQELNSSHPAHPKFAEVTWDKSKWHPRFYYPKRGWIRLDDPNLIWPHQLKPVTEWPIRYIAYYRGTDTAAAEEGITPEYDEYERDQFDREGYLLDNRTMKRKKTSDGNFVRMFQFRQFVKSVAVAPTDIDKMLENDGAPIMLNLKKLQAEPKVEYDKDSGFISAWASFDDPVKPILDKNNGNTCVMDCESRKRWQP